MHREDPEQKLLDARLSDVQWDALLDVVLKATADLPRAEKAGGAVVFAKLQRVHQKATGSYLLYR